MPSEARALWRFRFSPLWTDISLAALVFAAAVANTSNQDTADAAGIPVLGFLLLAVASVGLLWRRTLPPVALGGALAMMVIWASAGFPGNPVFHMLVALYAVGRYVAPNLPSLALAAAALAIATVIQALDGDGVSEVATAGVVTVLPWYIGRRVRIRGQYAAVLQERRATEAQRAISDARAAIARELHDVVAHNVSVMTVQAGVARLVAADDPERAQEAIQAIEEAGRQALEELRHLLGVLRPEDESGGLEPQPGLHQIDRLVQRLEATGMHISLSMDVITDVPVRTDLFAYRIVQEALTNVLKHAGVDAATSVRLEEAGGQLTIEVVNSGAATETLPGSGRGIVGMEERAALLGGTFEAGPRPEGGFRVLARLPIGDK